MRKSLVLTVAMLFALAGFAAADASLDGLAVKAELFIEGVSLDLGDSSYMSGTDKIVYAKDGEYLNGRGRFWFNYTKSDWKGVLALEIGEFTSYTGKGGGYLGTTSARDAKGVEVKNLYVAGPLGPLTLSAGLQPIALGYGIIMDEDYVALTAGSKVGPGNLLFAYVKHQETLYQDVDVTCFALTYGGTFGGVSLKPFAIYGLTDSDAADDFYFVGLPVGAKFGAVDVKAEIDYVGGEFGGTDDLSDFSFWAKANFGLGSANVYVEGGYATEFMKNIDENVTYDIVFEDRARGVTGLKNITFGKVGANMTMGALLLDAALIYNTQTEGEDIGTEVDIKASYKAADSVTFDFGYGYLLAGDYFADDQYKAYWKATYKY